MCVCSGIAWEGARFVFGNIWWSFCSRSGIVQHSSGKGLGMLPICFGVMCVGPGYHFHMVLLKFFGQTVQLGGEQEVHSG